MKTRMSRNCSSELGSQNDRLEQLRVSGGEGTPKFPRKSVVEAKPVVNPDCPPSRLSGEFNPFGLIFARLC